MTLVEIPETILDLHPSLALSMDHVYVQGISMLHSISGGYRFMTIEVARDQKKPSKNNTVRSASKVLNIYNARGLHVSQINADNEFECIRNNMRTIPMNIVVAGEHVGDIERYNGTIKERIRCHVHRFSYTRYPKEMVIGCVTHSVKGLNQLPANNGILEDQIPATLVIGAPSPNYQDITKLDFGNCILAHTARQRTNNNNPRMYRY